MESFIFWDESRTKKRGKIITGDDFITIAIKKPLPTESLLFKAGCYFVPVFMFLGVGILTNPSDDFPARTGLPLVLASLFILFYMFSATSMSYEVNFRTKTLYKKIFFIRITIHSISYYGGIARVWASREKKNFFYKLYLRSDKYGWGIPLSAEIDSGDTVFEDFFQKNILGKFSAILEIDEHDDNVFFVNESARKTGADRRSLYCGSLVKEPDCLYYRHSLLAVFGQNLTLKIVIIIMMIITMNAKGDNDPVWPFAFFEMSLLLILFFMVYSCDNLLPDSVCDVHSKEFFIKSKNTRIKNSKTDILCVETVFTVLRGLPVAGGPSGSRVQYMGTAISVLRMGGECIKIEHFLPGETQDTESYLEEMTNNFEFGGVIATDSLLKPKLNIA